MTNRVNISPNVPIIGRVVMVGDIYSPHRTYFFVQGYASIVSSPVQPRLIGYFVVLHDLTRIEATEVPENLINWQRTREFWETGKEQDMREQLAAAQIVAYNSLEKLVQERLSSALFRYTSPLGNYPNRALRCPLPDEPQWEMGGEHNLPEYMFDWEIDWTDWPKIIDPAESSDAIARFDEYAVLLPNQTRIHPHPSEPGVYGYWKDAEHSVFQPFIPNTPWDIFAWEVGLRAAPYRKPPLGPTAEQYRKALQSVKYLVDLKAGRPKLSQAILDSGMAATVLLAIRVRDRFPHHYNVRLRAPLNTDDQVLDVPYGMGGGSHGLPSAGMVIRDIWSDFRGIAQGQIQPTLYAGWSVPMISIDEWAEEAYAWDAAASIPSYTAAKERTHDIEQQYETIVKRGLDLLSLLVTGTDYLRDDVIDCMDELLEDS